MLFLNNDKKKFQLVPTSSNFSSNFFNRIWDSKLCFTYIFGFSSNFLKNKSYTEIKNIIIKVFGLNVGTIGTLGFRVPNSSYLAHFKLGTSWNFLVKRGVFL